MLPQGSPTQLSTDLVLLSTRVSLTSSICKPTNRSNSKARKEAIQDPDPTKKERCEMNGYCSLESSPPLATAAGTGARARRSLELTNTKETKAWEGLAIGAVTLARTFSTGSHRFCRSGSQRRSGGVPSALRRAFSMRRHTAGPGAGDGYWRIHDMDGDSDRGDYTVDEEHGEEEAEEKKKKVEEQAGGAATVAAAAAAEEEAKGPRKKKKRGGILKACKKLFWL
uniref:Uncharacterized protein n=1 Tax=Arundo donax TaxID=35708 RepID=A0A0A9CV02_ARUDO